MPPRKPTVAAPRIEVRKTYKLYIGGAFPRTESGRSYVVTGSDGAPLANACRASRKDLRDAVRAARKAFPGWAGKTAMNRGQVLYRVAELLEGRREQAADFLTQEVQHLPVCIEAHRFSGNLLTLLNRSQAHQLLDLGDVLGRHGQRPQPHADQ